MASSKWEKSWSHFRNVWWSDGERAGFSRKSGLRYTWKKILPLGSADQPAWALSLKPLHPLLLGGWGKGTTADSAQLLPLGLHLTESILLGYTRQNPQPREVLQSPWRSAISSPLWPDQTQLLPTCCPLFTDRWISSDGSVKVWKPKPSCLLLQRIPLFPGWEARVHSWTLSSGVSWIASLVAAPGLRTAGKGAGEGTEALHSILRVSVIVE